MKILLIIMAELKNLEAYDVYLFKTNGLPLLAGCTGSDYCMNHLPNHELHTAFMAALQSFSRESFSDNTVQTVMMQDFQLNMVLNPKNELIFGAVHSSGLDTNKIRELITKGSDLFIKKYEKELVHDILPQQTFDKFTEELLKLELIPETKANSILPDLDPQTKVTMEKSKKKGFFSRLLRR